MSCEIKKEKERIEKTRFFTSVMFKNYLRSRFLYETPNENEQAFTRRKDCDGSSRSGGVVRLKIGSKYRKSSAVGGNNGRNEKLNF